MSKTTAFEPTPDGPSALRVDALADSVLTLLVLTVVQRAVGFVRAVLFCRWLDAEQWANGRWPSASFSWPARWSCWPCRGPSAATPSIFAAGGSFATF